MSNTQLPWSPQQIQAWSSSRGRVELAGSESGPLRSWQVRQRYREASDVIKKGKLCSLFINDLDAGAVPLANSHSVYCLCQN